jgi:methyl coenzyme M reductase gamma subunit
VPEETGEEAVVFTDAPFMAVPQGLRQARSDMVRYRGAWNFETSGRNAFINEFRYEA